MDIVLIASTWADGQAWAARNPARRGHVLLVTPGNTTSLRDRRPHHVYATEAARRLPEFDALLAQAKRALAWLDRSGDLVA